MNKLQSRIGFIGAGRVGCTLGRYFVENGLNVSGFYSRTPENAKWAANFTDSNSYDNIIGLVSNSDIVFITVTDANISLIWKYIVDESKNNLNIRNKIFCHCSGALSSAVFSGIEQSDSCGYSVHPIFAVNDKQNSYKEISKAFFTIEGSKKNISDMADLFRSLGNEVQVISAENKYKYHSAAVMASNLVIGLYHMAASVLSECGFKQEAAARALLPLFTNNAGNLVNYGEEQALTGPVDRCDIETVGKHLDVLEGDAKDVYTALSRSLLEITKKKYDRDEDAMTELLNGNN